MANASQEIDKYMMATTAIHQLGDISRKTPDLCRVHKEDKENYIGSWVTGLGFIEVKFPKETTRDLTEAEIEKYNNQYVQLASNPPIKLKVN
jgi:hypothetical protein